MMQAAGQTLTFTYTTVRRGHDFFSVIASITDPLGRVVQYGYNTFHNGRLSFVIDPAGGVTQYTYGDLSPPPFYWNEGLQTITNPRGFPYLKNEYDTSGRIIRQVLADGSTYTFAYTLAGQTITQTAVTDPRGNVTTYSFNSAQYTSQVTAAGQLTQYQRQTGTNALTSVTDALNRVTTYTYDTNGNVASIQDPEGNLTQLQYESTFSRLTQITDALTPANITTFAYDDINRRTTITDPEGKQTVIQYNTAGQPTSITDPLTHVTSFAYDAQGNLTTTTDALGNVTARYYDAVSRLIGVTDPRGMLTRFSYDNLNRVTQIQDALSGLTTFTYDPNGNLLSVTDAKNQTTTYTYDDMDRLLTRTDPLNRTERYEYDKAGNLAKFTDRKNEVVTFTYDTLNRRTGGTYPDATVTFGYDAIGRLTSVSDSVGGNISWVYDVVSGGHHPRVAETTANGTVTVEYDEIGRRFKLSATGQTDVTYTYDKTSRLKTVTQGSQTVTLAYDDAGRRTTLTYPNGVVTSYGYDNANRLLTLSHVKTPTTIESLTYQYDSAGNRTSLNRANAAASLIPQAVSNTAYDGANQQTQFNGTTLTYDANGNLTNDGTTTYTWDTRNRLTGLSGAVTASFTYDGLGRRTSKTISGTTTGYWFDGNDIVAELNGGTPIATYLRSLNIDEPFVRQQSGGNEFYHPDALGSTVGLTDSAGASQTTYSHEPFGKTTVTGTSSNPFQYTGRENDGTGLHYYRARYYSPTLARFVSEDPIGFEGGLNTYAYVEDNPVNLVDALGLKCCDAQLPETPHREVALTCFGEATPNCTDGPAEKRAITDTVYNRLKDPRAYSAQRGASALDIMSARNPRSGKLEFEGFGNERFRAGKNPASLGQVACQELKDCIEAAKASAVSQDYAFTFFNVPNPEAMKKNPQRYAQRTPICKTYFFGGKWPGSGKR